MRVSLLLEVKPVHRRPWFLIALCLLALGAYWFAVRNQAPGALPVAVSDSAADAAEALAATTEQPAERSAVTPIETESTESAPAATESPPPVAKTPEFRITGFVEDANHHPVRDAAIAIGLLTSTSRTPRLVARSDADGRFAFDSNWSSFCIGASALDYAPSIPEFVSVPKGRREYDIVLSLPAGGGRVEGRVTNERGDVVREVRVRIRPEPSPLVVLFDTVLTTDDDGHYASSGLAAGPVEVVVTAPEFAMHRSKCDIALHAVTRHDITLTKGGRIEGFVRKQGGEAVRGARVEIGSAHELGHRSVETDESGHFAIDGVAAGEHLLVARHERAGLATASATVSQGVTCHIDLVLREGFVLSGRCIGPDGRGVEGIVVHASAPRSGKGRGSVTDHQGGFRIVDVPADHLRVETDNLEYERLVLRDVDPKAGDLVLNVVPRPPATVRIHGHVVDPNGIPVVGARITVHCIDHTDRTSGSTDEGGAIQLDPIRPGRHRVLVEDGRFPVHVAGPFVVAANAVLDLGTIRLVNGGHVVWQTGEAFDRGALLIETVGGYFLGASLLEKRTARSPLLAPGEYRVSLRIRGREDLQRVVRVRAGEETKIEADPVAGFEQDFRFPPSAVGEVFRIFDDADRLIMVREVHLGLGDSVRLPGGAYVVELGQRRKPFVVGEGARPIVDFARLTGSRVVSWSRTDCVSPVIRRGFVKSGDVRPRGSRSSFLFDARGVPQPMEIAHAYEGPHETRCRRAHRRAVRPGGAVVEESHAGPRLGRSLPSVRVPRAHDRSGWRQRRA
ncbi:MAG: carboxypeptidase regulatory-like domain-containing protein [Planctomycetes bacterium]|nr:carboxypeptidase regulatory-like domain-containing protein [Planctomycetota bacterium]